MEVNVYGQDGVEAGRTVTLEPSVFEIEPNDHAIWLDVRRIQASGRQGTHKTKERGEVTGSTRKLYRQKGTGYARAGSIKSPIRKSGGRTFGPRPRNYNMKVNRKTQLLARRSALTYKAREEAILVVDSLPFEEPSTRVMTAFIEVFDLLGSRVLLLTNGNNPAAYWSSRNLDKVSVRAATNASTLDLLGAKVIVVQEDALNALTQQLRKPTSTEQPKAQTS